MTLADQNCVPSAPGAQPLDAEQIESLGMQTPAWVVIDGPQLERELAFPDFQSALDFVVAVGAEAESQDHHPELRLTWGRVLIRLDTHDVGGLSESDFILAARIDRLAAAAGVAAQG